MEPEKPDELELAPVKPAAPKPHIRLTPLVVQGEVKCVYCGYNLKMLPRNGRCPECGKGVQESFGDPTFKQLNIKWSKLEIVAAGITALGFAAICVGLVCLLWEKTDAMTFLLKWSYVLIGAGSILLAVPEPGHAKSPRKTAWLLGIASVGLLAAWVSGFFEIELPFWSYMLAFAAHFFFLGLHLGMHVRRFDDGILARRFVIFGIMSAIGGGTFGLGSLAHSLLCFAFLIVLMYKLFSVLAIVFFGAWAYMLVRFALIMRDAIRMAKHQGNLQA